MSELKARLQKAQTDAMKARDPVRTQGLRMMMSNVRKREIDERKDLSDAEVEKVLTNMVKQLQETLDQAKTAGRAEAVTEAEAEIKLVKEFLPEAMSEAQVEEVVRKAIDELKAKGNFPAGQAGMGLSIKAAMAVVGARADGKLVQKAVKKILGI